MRAARLIGPKRFEIDRREQPPEPGPGEVLIRVDGCGLCASNLGPWGGIEGIGYPMDPGAPGHEVYGTVAAVGAGVARLAPGAAVTGLSYNGFADYDIARADALVTLPPALAGRPVPGEPLACAVNVTRRARVGRGDVVAVLGAGFLGALVLRLARESDPARIVAVSRRAKSLEVARRMGADDLLTYEEDVAGHIGRVTDGRMADVVIEATGKPRPLELAATLTRVRGRLVVAGYHQDGARRVDMRLWNWKGLDVINAHERDPAVYMRGMQAGVEHLAAGRFDLEPLLTHFVPLTEIDRAFELADRRPDDFVKAVVTAGDGG